MCTRARLASTALVLVAALVALLSSPPVAAADGLPVVGIDARPISAPGGELAYVTRRTGRGTTLEVIDADSERRLRRVRLPGRLSVPAVAYDSTPSGLTADGRKLVLIEPRRAFPRAETSFAVVDTRRLRIRRMLHLDGDFSFDAIAPDGRTMYLIRYLSPNNRLRYEVRAYDLRRDRLLREPIVDPREPDERMSGLPMTRATSPNGRWEYTLYDGGEHPFVHALDTERRRAFCVDLHGLGRPRATLLGATLELARAGAALAVKKGNRTLATIDTRTFRVSTPAGPGSAAAPVAARASDVPWLPVLVPTLLLTVVAAGAVARARLRSRRLRARA
jgi:hypothetical protein